MRRRWRIRESSCDWLWRPPPPAGAPEVEGLGVAAPDEEGEAAEAEEGDAAAAAASLECAAADAAAACAPVGDASGLNVRSPESCRSIMAGTLSVLFFADRCCAAAMCISFVFSLIKSMSF